VRTNGSIFLLLALIPFPLSAESLRESQERELFSKLRQRVEARTRAFDGLSGIYIREMRSGSEIAIDADRAFPAASTIKIFILAAALQSVDLDAWYELTREDIVGGTGILRTMSPGSRWRMRDLMTLMMSVSDNTATNVLIEQATQDRINTLIRNHAGRTTTLQRRMMDAQAADSGRENLITAREAGRFLAAVEAEEVLDRSAAARFHAMMQLSEATPFRRRLPAGATAESKSGELEGIRNEVAMFRSRGRSLIVVVLTSHSADEREAERLLGEVAADCWSTLDRIGRADATGRLRK
jgi:beta-lactamase class A